MIAPMLKWLKIPSVATLHNLKRNVQAFEKYDRIIAVSRRVANQFSQQDRVRVVLNGIQPPVHQAAQNSHINLYKRLRLHVSCLPKVLIYWFKHGKALMPSSGLWEMGQIAIYYKKKKAACFNRSY